MKENTKTKKWKKGGCILLAAAMVFLAGRGAASFFEQWTATGNFSPTVDNWGLGFGAEGEKPIGNVSPEELKQYDTYYVGEHGCGSIFDAVFGTLAEAEIHAFGKCKSKEVINRKVIEQR